jgi:hypothetical protein
MNKDQVQSAESSDLYVHHTVYEGIAFVEARSGEFKSLGKIAITRVERWSEIRETGTGGKKRTRLGACALIKLS